MAGPFYVVVSGSPGSGKSTLASALADGLGLPLLSKDIIKEALLGSFPAPTSWARAAWGGRPWKCCSPWQRRRRPVGSSRPTSIAPRVRSSIRDLPGRTVEVFCRCPREVARARYRARADGRAAGHFDADRTDDGLWRAEVNEPVAGGWPVVEVATDGPVDMTVLLDRLGVVAAR